MSDEKKPFGGKDLRDLLIGNSQFRVMWIDGVRYEMKDEDPPVSEVRMHAKSRPHEDLAWFYVSFAGDDGFLGVVHIDAKDENAVLERTNELKVNPGGEMLILAIPDDIAEKVLAHGYARRLLSEDDLHALDRLIEGEESPGPKRLSELTDEETQNVASHTAGRICETHNNAIDVKVKTP